MLCRHASDIYFLGIAFSFTILESLSISRDDEGLIAMTRPVHLTCP